MSTYICKCGQRVQKSSSADNTGNRLKGYGPGHECYGCPYAMPWGGNKWNETAKRFVLDIKGYECRMSRTLSYDSLFIGSTKDKCTCSVFSLDFDFLEQISAWVKDTFPQGELTGGFSRDKIRPTDYSHNGRYCCTFVCAANKKGISAKAALLARFFNPDGSRKDMTPQQEMEKILADIKKAKEVFACAPAQNADAAVTAAENAVPTATAATPTTSENAADVSASTPAVSPQACGSAPAALADGSSAPLLSMTGGAPQDNPLTFIQKDKCPEFDYSGLPEQTVATLHLAENGYLHGKKLAEKGLVYMGDNIALAHDELCGVVAQCDNSKHGNRGEDSFRAWCLHIGITKDSAYRLLQVSALLADSSPRQQAILESLPPTLLYAVAKPSAPPELVEKVKNGEVTTNKAYQDLLKENQQLRTDRVEAMNQADRERARADAAETREEEARKAAHEYHEKYEEAAAMRSTLLDQQGVYIADISGLKEQNAQLQQSYHDADESRIAANLQRQKAEAERDRAEARAKDAENQLSGSRQVAEAAKLRADKLQEENAALKKQPIAAVVDEEEVERRANQRAHDIAEDLAAEMTADLQARLEQASSGSEQDARDAYDSIILAGRSITSIVQSAKMQFRKLPNDQRETAINQFVHTLASAQGEVSACL